LRQHIEQDVAVNNPCQIILAQEVDAGFIELLSTTVTKRHVPVPAVAGVGSSSSGPAAAGVASSSFSPAVAGVGSSSSCPAAAGVASSSSGPTAATSEAAGVESSSWMAIEVTGGSGDPYGGWLVVRGDEPGPTCIVAGKRSIFKSITRLEWHLSSGGTYKSKGKARTKITAWSRVLVAELEFWTPCAGFDKVRVASVHMHRMPAKRQHGFCQGASDFWEGLHHRLINANVDFVGGDFNMSLYDTVSRLKREGSAVTLLAAHAWRMAGEISAVAEEPGEDSDDHQLPLRHRIPPPPEPRRLPTVMRPPSQPRPVGELQPRNLTAVAGDWQLAPQQPATVGLLQPSFPGLVHRATAAAGDGQQTPQHMAEKAMLESIRCDSCGIFAVGKPTTVKRVLSVEHFTGAQTMELKEALSGPGYKLGSYVSGIHGVKESLVDKAAVAADSGGQHRHAAVAADSGGQNTNAAAAADSGGQRLIPPCNEKAMLRSDPTGLLSRGGAAHVPLAVYVGGGNPRRSSQSLSRRFAIRSGRGHNGQGWRGGRGHSLRGGQANQAGWWHGQAGHWDDRSSWQAGWQ
jgi:hypothetical protein